MRLQYSAMDQEKFKLLYFISNTMKTRKLTQCIVFVFITFLCFTSHGADIPLEKEYSTVEERRLANTLIQERANIRKEREEIALREKELKTLEDGVDKKIAEIDRKLEDLKKLQRKIEGLLAEKDAEEKKRIQSLAKIYEKMTPVRAAMAMSNMDRQLASDLLSSMKVKAAAKILDKLSKQKASELSTTFSTLQLE